MRFVLLGVLKLAVVYDQLLFDRNIFIRQEHFYLSGFEPCGSTLKTVAEAFGGMANTFERMNTKLERRKQPSSNSGEFGRMHALFAHIRSNMANVVPV